MTDASRELAPGAVVGERWSVVKRLGEGGMGAVYEVRHVRTGKRAALKSMRADLADSKPMQARFRQEMTVTASLESDHIVPVFDGGSDEVHGVLYLVMALLQGADLWDVRQRGGGRLAAGAVAAYLSQAAIGLDLAHAAGVVHRDLKPANLFLTHRDDGSPCVKVLDFGIAKLIAESLSSAKTTQALGTPSFMSPEQIRGDGAIGYAADVYSLAHVAFDLIVGLPYFELDRQRTSNLYGLLMAITRGGVEPASARAAAHGVLLPPAFDDWFFTATALDPLRRHASILEAAAGLVEIFGSNEEPPSTVRAEPTS